MQIKKRPERDAFDLNIQSSRLTRANSPFANSPATKPPTVCSMIDQLVRLLKLSASIMDTWVDR